MRGNIRYDFPKQSLKGNWSKMNPKCIRIRSQSHQRRDQRIDAFLDDAVCTRRGSLEAGREAVGGRGEQIVFNFENYLARYAPMLKHGAADRIE